MTEATPKKEELGSRIRRLRIELGLGQERLAIEAHVDQSGLSKFERGKDNRALSEAALGRLAAVLNTSFENLIEGTTYQRAVSRPDQAKH
jgi:transcriptional regulator with XRE-family HTH domain